VFSFEVKRNFDFRKHFFVGFLDLGKEGMCERFVNRNAEVGVELQHTVNQINRLWRRTRILLGKVNPFDRHEALKVADGLLVSHE